MPMSDTPNKMLFITINDSAAEFEKARRVAFMVSEPSYKPKGQRILIKTYNSFLFDGINGWVDVVLGHK